MKESSVMSQTVILACPTLEQELKEAIKSSASKAEVYFLPRHLHNDPKELHSYLQEKSITFITWIVSSCVSADVEAGLPLFMRRQRRSSCRAHGTASIFCSPAVI